jgi:SAM-dependent methyltransferase
MYPAMDGIPIFATSSEQTWPESALREILEGRRIEDRWRRCEEPMLDDGSKLAEFARRMAEGGGLILDVGSGPGGGFAPRVLRIDREATVLMDDLGFGVLREWQRVLRGKGLPNASFALFDARKMPLESNSLDAIGDIGGFGNIEGSGEAIEEAHRVLKPGGKLFSYNDMVEREDFLKLPRDVGAKWYAMNPSGFDGFLGAFERAGFKVISNSLEGGRELSPDEGEFPGEAARYGVRIHVREYCTEAIK